MHKMLRVLCGIASLSLALVLPGCGGGTSTPPDPRTADVSTTAQDVDGTGVLPAEHATDAQLLANREQVRTMAGNLITVSRKPITVPSSLPVIPADTWQPRAGAVPDTGNALLIEDNGQTFLYAAPNSSLPFSIDGTSLTIGNATTLGWEGHLRSLRGHRQWRTGYYASTGNYPLSTMFRASMNWRTTSTSCTSPTGWIAVDNVVYDGDRLSHIDLRFEQTCQNPTWLIRGRFRWTSPSTVQPPSIPVDLWQPAAGATPATGSYVYLESDAGDYIGQGRSYLYTRLDSVLKFTLTEGYLRASVDGDEWWYGDFQAMSGVTPLQVGYYPLLQRYPFHNPAHGGLSWSGDGRGCNQLTGWFAIDNISVNAGAVTAVDLRFEQHCEGWSQALRGKIHWRQDDPTTPPGPQFPPPADLWRPVEGTTPGSGSFVYLESSPGDWVGGGLTRLFTPDTANMRITSSGRQVGIQIEAGTSWWYGNFEAMELLSRLQPGYYPNAFRYPLNNPTRPGLSWYGDGRGCNKNTGWFVVDHISYEGALLTAFEARFEQNCDSSTGPLRGHVKWTIN